MLKELKELETKHYIIAIATFSALFSPGLLCLFHYKNNLFSSLDIIKLITLSISLSLPLLIFNYMIFFFPITEIDTKYNNKSGILFVWIFASFLTTIILNIGLYVSFIFHLTFRQFTYVLVIIEIPLILISYIIIKNIKKNKSSEKIEYSAPDKQK